MALKSEDFVKAAMLGAVRCQDHVQARPTPTPVIVSATRHSWAILSSAALGSCFGVQPPWPEWGAMVSEAKDLCLSTQHDYPPGMRFPRCAQLHFVRRRATP